MFDHLIVGAGFAGAVLAAGHPQGHAAGGLDDLLHRVAAAGAEVEGAGLSPRFEVVEGRDVGRSA